MKNFDCEAADTVCGWFCDCCKARAIDGMWTKGRGETGSFQNQTLYRAVC